MNYSDKIDKNSHYFFIPLQRDVLDTDRLSNAKWVEYEIDKRRHKLDDPNNFKVELRPLESGYDNEVFYQNDFLDLVRKEEIVRKVGDMHCVEKRCAVPLTSTTYFHLSMHELDEGAYRVGICYAGEILRVKSNVGGILLELGEEIPAFLYKLDDDHYVDISTGATVQVLRENSVIELNSSYIVPESTLTPIITPKEMESYKSFARTKKFDPARYAKK